MEQLIEDWKEEVAIPAEICSQTASHDVAS